MPQFFLDKINYSSKMTALLSTDAFKGIPQDSTIRIKKPHKTFPQKSETISKLILDNSIPTISDSGFIGSNLDQTRGGEDLTSDK